MSNELGIVCPECGGVLHYRDSRLRICKRYGGDTTWLLIRRLKCVCGRIHNEMPDILVPHKHYANEVIENVLDEVSTPFDESTEDYPCEATMNRWKQWLMKNQQQIEGITRSVGYTILGFSERFLESKCSLLDSLRKNGYGWLSAILRLIYNASFRLSP